MVQCTNCGVEVADEVADNHYQLLEKFPQQEGSEWCSPECFLSFQKPRVRLYAFTRLRSDVSEVYQLSIRERPPRNQLKSQGGSLTMAAYHQQTNPQLAKAAQKRVTTHSRS